MDRCNSCWFPSYVEDASQRLQDVASFIFYSDLQPIRPNLHRLVGKIKRDFKFPCYIIRHFCGELNRKGSRCVQCFGGDGLVHQRMPDAIVRCAVIDYAKPNGIAAVG